MVQVNVVFRATNYVINGGLPWNKPQTLNQCPA